MMLLERFSSETEGNINAIFYGFSMSFFVLMMASFGCLYALFLDLPILIMLIFIAVGMFLLKQTIEAGKAILSLTKFVKELKVHDNGIEVKLVPNRYMFHENSCICDAKIISVKNVLFKKILPCTSNLFEILVRNKKYYISLSSNKSEILKSLVRG